jgi:hypothetical protein
MGRLIEVGAEASLPPSLAVKVGDVLMFGATGGRVLSGFEVVEFLGPFLPGLLTGSGKILSPEGVPNTLLFVARHPGRAEIEAIAGHPWGVSRSTVLVVIVED